MADLIGYEVSLLADRLSHRGRYRYTNPMHFLLAAFAFQGVQVQSSTAPSVEANTPLWQGLSAGMSPESAAATLQSISEVEKVTVKRGRKGARLAIKLKTSGIRVADWTVVPQVNFLNDRLASVELSETGCASVMVERIKRTIRALREKYGNSAQERVVDEDGVEIEMRVAIWDDRTRVRISWAVSAPGVYVPSGASGKLGRIADSLGAIASDVALMECPADDYGAKLAATITYSAQSEFLAEQAKMKLENASRSEDLKKGL